MGWSDRVGWALALVAHAVGYAAWGWRGVALAFSLTVFWLLLQFSRTLRVLRQAAAAPQGRVANAVMLHSRLRPRLRLLQVLPLTASLGERVQDAGDAEIFRWTDAGGDSVVLAFEGGRLQRWRLVRADEAASPVLHLPHDGSGSAGS